MLHNARKAQDIVEPRTQEYNNCRLTSSLAYPAHWRSLPVGTTKRIRQRDIDSHGKNRSSLALAGITIGDTLPRLQLKEVS